MVRIPPSTLLAQLNLKLEFYVRVRLVVLLMTRFIYFVVLARSIKIPSQAMTARFEFVLRTKIQVGR